MHIYFYITLIFLYVFYSNVLSYLTHTLTLNKLKYKSHLRHLLVLRAVLRQRMYACILKSNFKMNCILAKLKTIFFMFCYIDTLFLEELFTFELCNICHSFEADNAAWPLLLVECRTVNNAFKCLSLWISCKLSAINIFSYLLFISYFANCDIMLKWKLGYKSSFKHN